MFKVIGTDTYLRELKKFPKSDQEIARAFPQQLCENPFLGKPLTYPFLREKKIGGRRIYYLVYENLKLILLVATSDKKDQQETINRIKSQLYEFKKVAEE